MRALLALVFIGVGIWLITSMHARTETTTARLSTTFLVATRADAVVFKFADGSEDEEVASSTAGLYEAVAQFGPGPARVTRNAKNNTIYKVAFLDKTYTLDSPGGNLGAGIAAIVLGVLGLAFVLFTL